MTDQPLERRTASRYRPGATGRVKARIRPGHVAALVDLSTGGALVETSRRLLPNSCVEISMESESRRATLRGRVLRCAVARVGPDVVHYRAAIQFDSYLPWFVEDDGCVVREGGVAGQTIRAAATPRAR